MYAGYSSSSLAGCRKNWLCEFFALSLEERRILIYIHSRMYNVYSSSSSLAG